MNKVVPKGQALAHALDWAREMVDNSPDAVQSTKRAILISLQHGNVEQATVANAWSAEARRLYKGENIKVRSFHSTHLNLRGANCLFLCLRKT